LEEALRDFLPRIKPGFGGVFLAKKAIIGPDLKAIKTEMERLLRRGGLL